MPNVNLPLSIATYNSHGHGLDRLMYMNKLLKCIDILLIQEHWLLDSTIVREVTPGSIRSRGVWYEGNRV